MDLVSVDEYTDQNSVPIQFRIVVLYVHTFISKYLGPKTREVQSIRLVHSDFVDTSVHVLMLVDTH